MTLESDTDFLSYRPRRIQDLQTEARDLPRNLPCPAPTRAAQVRLPSSDPRHVDEGEHAAEADAIQEVLELLLRQPARDPP